MKASEFIKVLQKAIDEYGDLEVAASDIDYGFSISSTLKPTILDSKDSDFHSAYYDCNKKRFGYDLNGEKGCSTELFENNTVFIIK